MDAKKKKTAIIVTVFSVLGISLAGGLFWMYKRKKSAEESPDMGSSGGGSDSNLSVPPGFITKILYSGQAWGSKEQAMQKMKEYGLIPVYLGEDGTDHKYRVVGKKEDIAKAEAFGFRR